MPSLSSLLFNLIVSYSNSNATKMGGILDNNLVLDGTGLETKTIEADVVALGVGLLEVFEDSLALVDQHAKTAIVVFVLLVVENVVVQVLDPDSHHSG
jgi:hypothetical protein